MQKRSLKISFKKKGHQKRSFIEIYLDSDHNEDRNSQGGSLLWNPDDPNLGQATSNLQVTHF